MRFNNSNIPVLLVILISLSSCSGTEKTSESAIQQDSVNSTQLAKQPASHQDQSANQHASAIDWFSGTVEEAFNQAKKQRKPLYLYWGAIWCPPCQEIKSTVFKNNFFLAQSKLFVPVYLDGDTKRAQSWGEHFGVRGYPTMIVFNPDGVEITRIPGGIDVSRYTKVLELSLNSMRPTTMLIDLAIHSPGELQTGDFAQLAYYSWQQDNDALPADQGSSLFKSIAELAKDKNPEASARLYLQYLATLVDERKATSEGQESGTDPTSPHVSMPEAIDRITQILASDDLTLACWDYLAYYSEPLLSLISIEGETRDQLIQLWQQKTLSFHRADTLSTAEQLAAWFPTLELYWLQSPEGNLDQELISRLRADVTQADQITRSPYARQSVVNQMNHLLQTARLEDEAEKLLLAELETSRSPYYFMSSLAGLSEKQEHFDAAIQWRKQAYEASKGAATRLQWGAAYIRSIIRMQPDQQDQIKNTSLNLLQEFDNNDETLAGRNYRVLRSLNNMLLAWQEQRNNAGSLDSFHNKLQQLCSKSQSSSQESKNCNDLLTNWSSGTPSS